MPVHSFFLGCSHACFSDLRKFVLIAAGRRPPPTQFAVRCHMGSDKSWPTVRVAAQGLLFGSLLPPKRLSERPVCSLRAYLPVGAYFYKLMASEAMFRQFQSETRGAKRSHLSPAAACPAIPVSQSLYAAEPLVHLVGVPPRLSGYCPACHFYRGGRCRSGAWGRSRCRSTPDEDGGSWDGAIA